MARFQILHIQHIFLKMVEPLRNFLRCLSVSLASYSELHSSNQGIFEKMFSLSKSSRKYFVDPEMCASRIVEVANKDVHVLSVS